MTSTFSSQWILYMPLCESIVYVTSFQNTSWSQWTSSGIVDFDGLVFNHQGMNIHNADRHPTTLQLQWRHNECDDLTFVYSTIYSYADQRKHQSFASLAFVRGIHRWPVNSPHKGQVTRKVFPFDDLIMPLTQLVKTILYIAVVSEIRTWILIT